MRCISFLLALAFVVAGPSLAGRSDGGPPGIGTFVYGGLSIVTAAPAIVVATR